MLTQLCSGKDASWLLWPSPFTIGVEFTLSVGTSNSAAEALPEGNQSLIMAVLCQQCLSLTLLAADTLQQCCRTAYASTGGKNCSQSNLRLSGQLAAATPCVGYGSASVHGMTLSAVHGIQHTSWPRGPCIQVACTDTAVSDCGAGQLPLAAIQVSHHLA